MPNRKELPEGHAVVIRELVVPVLRADKVVAILGVGNKPERYDEDDVAMVLALADFAWDIAEHKRDVDALRESEQRHRIVLQTAMDGVVRLDSHGRLLEVNEAYCRMSGYTEADLLNLTIADLEAQKTPDELAAIAAAISVRGRDRLESIHRRKDGRDYHVEISIARHDSEGAWASMIAVTDAGYGMDETTRAQVFEPFFTAKGVGQGTGLGLATVYGIVKQHHGAIQLQTAPGAGTVFEIYLPRADQPVATVDSPPGLPATGGSEGILIAEDEEGVRSLLCRQLTAAGYTVYPARNGLDALRVFDVHADAMPWPFWMS